MLENEVLKELANLHLLTTEQTIEVLEIMGYSFKEMGLPFRCVICSKVLFVSRDQLAIHSDCKYMFPFTTK